MTSILLIIIVLNGLPVLLLLSLYFRKSKKNLPVKRQCQPVSIIIACYNEGKFIQPKLDELLDPDEWIEGSEIIIVSNGSSDKSSEVLKKYSDDSRVKIYFFEERIGKIRAMNFGLTIAKHPILIFSDCRQRIKKHSIKSLIYNFSDSKVSLVTAVLWDDEKKPSLIRRTINGLSQLESRAGICFSVHGAMFAIRKESFPVLPTDILCEDLYINAHVVSNGGQVHCETNAIIYDLNFKTYYNRERIERLTRGLMLFIFNHFKILWKMNPVALQIFLWHKYAKIYNLLLFIAVIIFFLSGEAIRIEFIGISLIIIVVLFASRHHRIILAFMVYQLTALIKFCFNMANSAEWEKLFINRKNI